MKPIIYVFKPNPFSSPWRTGTFPEQRPNPPVHKPHIGHNYALCKADVVIVMSDGKFRIIKDRSAKLLHIEGPASAVPYTMDMIRAYYEHVFASVSE
jgi:hypothetical protein